MNRRMPLPDVQSTPQPGPRWRPYRDADGFNHYEECPLGAPDPAAIQWVCDEGHWLAWDIPPAVGDRCPVIFHDATSDSRCVGTLSRPECICLEAGRERR